MAREIPEFRQADLPKREKSFWRMTGPGAVMVGLAIGSGEMIMWPWIVAKFGAGMAWAAMLGIFMQVWVNFEIGRWAIATGESAFTGFARVSRKFILIMMGALFILALLPAWGRATAVCIRYLAFGLEGPGKDWQWSILVYILVFAILFGPKRIYSTLEKIILVMVAIVLLGMTAVAFQIGTWGDVAEMGRGLINVPHIDTDDEFTFLRLFGAMVFVGAGGFGQLYYAYYLRDKGIGMGAQIPELTSAIRDKGDAETEIGFLYPDTEENHGRFKDWFNFVKLDNTIYFFFLNLIVTLLFMYGALVVLHAKGIVPSEANIIWDLSQMLQSIMGEWGRILFLVIALCAMLSTQLAVSDGSYRLWTDMLHTNFEYFRRFTTSQCYMVLAIVLAVIGVLSTWFFETFEVGVLDFFFINAALNGAAMALWIPMILYMNMKFLPESARPRPLNIVMVLLSALFYASFAVYTLWDKLSGLFS